MWNGSPVPTPTTHRKWGKRIAKERAERKLSQTQLAAAVDVNTTSIWRIERGDIAPSDMLRLRLAAFFGIPVHELFPFPTLAQATKDLRREIEDAAAANGLRATG